MKLYEIDEQILNCIDAETGEIIDADMLNALQIERDAKIENVALWIKDLKAEAEAYKAEKQAFEKRQKTCENRAESLKQWLAAALNGERFKTTKCDVSFRTAKSVNVTDVFALDSKFVKFSDPTADKTAIKKAIEAGETVNGAELIERKSVTIK